MQDITKVVDLLEDKLRLLLERYDFLKEENELLLTNMAAMKIELDQKEQLLSEKEASLQSLRVAKTIQGSSDNTKETSQKINTLIKEIDTCIAQLSD